MFRKRQKKEFPPGTFIPMPARLCAIIQLCLAFIVILWNLSQPFMGELFAFKSQILLYQDVMGISPKQETVEKQARMRHNAERFQALPLEEKQLILKSYQKLEALLERSFFTKMGRSLHILFFEMPTYEQVWLLLSIVLPILLLKRVEGASQAIWLLPLLTSFYAYDNQLFGRPTSPTAEARLFPSEEVIVAHYLSEPLSKNVFGQSEQLLRGWKRYLVKEWTKEQPSSDSLVFNQQAEKGEFLFTLARLKALPAPNKMLSSKPPAKEPISLLAVYLFWNFFFAYIAWQKTTAEQNVYKN